MNIRSELPTGNGADTAALVAALRNPALYPHPVQRVELVETHISWVLLTGDYAYKIKKPVNLGFLDFTTLDSRRHYCAEELRLNRRLAPALYLDVVPITGTPRSPAFAGSGPPIEYAVKMRQFAQSALLDSALARGEVGAEVIAQLARTIAEFHARLAPAAVDDGANTLALAPARDNFAQMLPLVYAPADIAALKTLREWMLREYETNTGRFRQRCADGYVRECHGDLHLGNIALIDGTATAFDCIEFNAALRCMDVMSEVAFTMMDLEAHAHRDLAYTFLDTYLESSGDYAGVAQLPFYCVYRALVRAKVNLIRTAQPDTPPAERQQAHDEYRHYVGIAAARANSKRGAIIITHGLSGSGKTTLTRPLAATLGAVRVRSDIERKRLHGLGAFALSAAATGAGIYAGDATVQTYRQLLRHARSIAGAGMPVIVDATFLRLEQRADFHALARQLDVPFAIVNVAATHDELRARVAARAARGDDASEATVAVLEAQIGNCDALTAEEMGQAFTITAEPPAATHALTDQLTRRFPQLIMSAAHP